MDSSPDCGRVEFVRLDWSARVPLEVMVVLRLPEMGKDSGKGFGS